MTQIATQNAGTQSARPWGTSPHPAPSRGVAPERTANQKRVVGVMAMFRQQWPTILGNLPNNLQVRVPIFLGHSAENLARSLTALSPTSETAAS